MQPSITHDPKNLYYASCERMSEAHRTRSNGDFVLCSYLSGLAVECVLQSIVHLDRPGHDAKHDLAKWLSRTRLSLQNEVKAPEIRGHWSFLVSVWRNDLRYLPESGLLSHFRRLELYDGIKGGPDAIIKSCSERVLAAAQIVHDKGVAAWLRYTNK